MCVTLLQAMIETQNRLQNYIDGFRFNLGFSGKFFHHGSPEENQGDDALIGKWELQNHFVLSQYHYLSRHCQHYCYYILFLLLCLKIKFW